MQQRQLRLGDILDDYCPRERRVTNHAIVAMVGDAVKQTRCTTCDAEHEYKHAKVPRQRRKADSPPALYAQVAAGAPKRVAHETPDNGGARREPEQPEPLHEAVVEEPAPIAVLPPSDNGATSVSTETNDAAKDADPATEDDEHVRAADEGPVHRPLIRASLPRPEGHQPPARPIPEFTIRQPGGRQNRFRPRHQRGGQQFQGNRGGNMSGGPPRGMRPGGRPPQSQMPSRLGRHHGPGRKRSK